MMKSLRIARNPVGKISVIGRYDMCDNSRQGAESYQAEVIFEWLADPVG